MSRQNSMLAGLSDEKILDEFVKRFECDGAILIYLDGNIEYGFARSTSSHGRKWTTELMKVAKEHLSLPNNNQLICDEEEARFTDLTQPQISLVK